MPAGYRLVARRKGAIDLGGGRYQVSVLDVASHQQTAVFEHATYNLLYGRFSPDDSWVSFTARIQPDRARVRSRLWMDRNRFLRAPGFRYARKKGPKIGPGLGRRMANTIFHVARDGTLPWGRRTRSKLPPAGRSGLCRAASSRTVSYQQGGWSAAGGRIEWCSVRTGATSG